MSSHDRNVLVFSKLASFHGAADNVRKELGKMLNDSETDTFKVEPFQQSNTSDDLYKLYKSVTAVVVIDARQTRTLITPERRDKNVDHWDELHMLCSKYTKPQGSVLVVIYGDEWSKALDERKLVAKNWITIWKFNDTTVCHDLADKERCFSIWDTFNEKQRRTIREYLKTDRDNIPYGLVTETLNKLVIGGKMDYLIYDDVHMNTTDLGDVKVMAYTTRCFDYDNRHKHKAILRMHHVSTIQDIQVCHSYEPIKHTIERHVKQLPIIEIVREDSGDVKEILYFAHCDKCVKKLELEVGLTLDMLKSHFKFLQRDDVHSDDKDKDVLNFDSTQEPEIHLKFVTPTKIPVHVMFGNVSGMEPVTTLHVPTPTTPRLITVTPTTPRWITVILIAGMGVVAGYAIKRLYTHRR
ncbi:uncharacterized protein LOC144445078 [Glandiceps talaboti]